MLSQSGDPHLREKVSEAALALAERRAWGALFPTDVAQKAGMDPSALYGVSGPDDLVVWVEEWLDRAAAKGLAPVDHETPVRDRLFDVAMRRFEAMEAKRAAVLAMDRWLESQPALRLKVWAQTRPRTAQWIAALAGVEEQGLRAALFLPGLGLVLGQARHAWRLDDAGDFARTMAALDRGLRDLEDRLAGLRFPLAPNKPRDGAQTPS